MYYAYFDRKGELKAIAETTEKLGEAIGVTGACVSYHLRRNNPQYAAYETKKDLNQGVKEHMNMPEIPDKSSRVFAKFFPNGTYRSVGEYEDGTQQETWNISRDCMPALQIS